MDAWYAGESCGVLQVAARTIREVSKSTPKMPFVRRTSEKEVFEEIAGETQQGWAKILVHLAVLQAILTIHRERDRREEGV